MVTALLLVLVTVLAGIVLHDRHARRVAEKGTRSASQARIRAVLDERTKARTARLLASPAGRAHLARTGFYERHPDLAEAERWRQINEAHRLLGLPALDPETGLWIAHEEPVWRAKIASPAALRFHPDPAVEQALKDRAEAERVERLVKVMSMDGRIIEVEGPVV